MEAIINKVAESGIITLDLANFKPAQEDFLTFDLKPFLFREMILREKDYREALQQFDFTPFRGKYVNIECSVDAIIPVWAYMLAAVNLDGVAKQTFFGSSDELFKQVYIANINSQPTEQYADKRVVIKGCGDDPIPDYAYVAVTSLLKSHVKSLMYGEPCSTVPLYKQKVKSA